MNKQTIFFRDKYNDQRTLKGIKINDRIIKDEYGSLWDIKDIIIIKKENK